MKPQALVALSIVPVFALVFTGCESMKNSMSKFQEKSSGAAQQAQASTNEAAAQHDAAWNSAAGGTAAQQNQSGGSQGGSNTGGAATAGSSGAGGSDTAASGDAAVTDETTGTEDASTSSGAGDAGQSYEYVPDCSKPTNRPEDVDASGTEPMPWHDAKQGRYMRYRMGNDPNNTIEMSQEVKEGRDKIYLVETKTFMNGKLVSCDLSWTARYYKKIEPTEPVEMPEYETKTTDLPDETLDLSGRKVNCKVQRVWTKIGGANPMESTAVIWTSDEIPGTMVKSANETANGLEVAYLILEYRDS